MKAKENVLYFLGDWFGGKLIDENGFITKNIDKETPLSQDTADKLLELLNDYNNDLRHRCISIYRHAIIINGDIYNICLSCGDYYKNDEKEEYYIHNEGKIKLLLGIDK